MGQISCKELPFFLLKIRWFGNSRSFIDHWSLKGRQVCWPHLGSPILRTVLWESVVYIFYIPTNHHKSIRVCLIHMAWVILNILSVRIIQDNPLLSRWIHKEGRKEGTPVPPPTLHSVWLENALLFNPGEEMWRKGTCAWIWNTPGLNMDTFWVTVEVRVTEHHKFKMHIHNVLLIPEWFVDPDDHLMIICLMPLTYMYQIICVDMYICVYVYVYLRCLQLSSNSCDHLCSRSESWQNARCRCLWNLGAYWIWQEEPVSGWFEKGGPPKRLKVRGVTRPIQGEHCCGICWEWDSQIHTK